MSSGLCLIQFNMFCWLVIDIFYVRVAINGYEAELHHVS